MIRLSLVEQAPPVKSNESGDTVSKLSFTQLRVRICRGKSLPQRLGMNNHSRRAEES